MAFKVSAQMCGQVESHSLANFDKLATDTRNHPPFSTLWIKLAQYPLSVCVADVKAEKATDHSGSFSPLGLAQRSHSLASDLELIELLVFQPNQDAKLLQKTWCPIGDATRDILLCMHRASPTWLTSVQTCANAIAKTHTGPQRLVLKHPAGGRVTSAKSTQWNARRFIMWT